MRLLYVANVRMPTEKAHGIQIAEMCNAFAQTGVQVVLLLPKRDNEIKEDIFSYYGIPQSFAVTYVPVSDTVRFGFLGFLYETYSFIKAVKKYLSEAQLDVVYGRDELVLAGLLKLGGRFVWESHTGVWNWAVRKLVAQEVPIVAISRGLDTFYKKHDVPFDRLFVAHDGFSDTRTEESYSKKDLRRILSLPEEGFLTVYTGKLDSWKGVETFLRAATYSKEVSTFVVVGGNEKQIAPLKAAHKEVYFIPYVHPQIAERYQRAADLLVLPNTAKNIISKYYTSPLKLFNYMASGNPLLVSDLPSVREIVNEENAYFFKPDDSEDLAEKIRYIKEHMDEAYLKAVKAKEHVRGYAWQRRAEKIIAFVKNYF
jgi:glycosyltransferase involved in cell wall biosynthesis